MNDSDHVVAMETVSEERLAEMLAGLEGVTPGPWEADGVRNEGGSGRFESYQVLAVSLERYGKPPSLVDTLNSAQVELHEDGDSESHSVWDEQGRKDTLHIARLDPETVRSIISELLASRLAKQGWQGIESEEAAVDALRLTAFKTNAPNDRQAYFDAASKWFQDRHYRRMADQEPGWKGMAHSSSWQAAIAVEDRRQLMEDGTALLAVLPAHWHDEATTNFRDLVASIEKRLAAPSPVGGSVS